MPFSQLLLKEHLQTLGFEAAPFLPLGIFPAACSISQRAGFSSAGFVPGSAMARNLYIERIEKSEKLFIIMNAYCVKSVKFNYNLLIK